jgi:hypothetical protein
MSSRPLLDNRRRLSTADSGDGTLVNLFIVCLTAAFLAWAIVMTVLWATNGNGGSHKHNRMSDNICNHVPGKAVLDSDDGCIYSSKFITKSDDAIKQFMGDYFFCEYWLYAGDWDLFTGGNGWSTWGTTADTNPLIANFDQVNATIQNTLSKSSTTFTERAILRQVLTSFSLLPDLAKLHHFHTGGYDYQWWWNSPAPPRCAVDHASVLPLFSNEPDYTAKSMRFMEQTQVALEQMTEYYSEALDANILWFNDSSSRTWYLDWVEVATPGVMQPICDAMPEPADQTECSAISSQIDAAAAVLADFMENQWIPACNAGFNYESTGRSSQTNGVEASTAWLRFFYTDQIPVEEQSAVGYFRDAVNGERVQALLDDQFPGTTLAQWTARQNDLDDTDVWLCSPELAPIAELTQKMWDNTSVWSQQVFGIGSFDVATPTFSVSSTAGGFYNTGVWDSLSLLWRQPSVITYGLALKEVGNQSQMCFKQYEYGLVNHEGLFGHARQVPMVRFSQCKPDPLSWAAGTAGSYYEGFAVYGDYFISDLSQMPAECPRCEMSHLGYASYANIGSMFDFSFYNNLTFSQCVSQSLASGTYVTASLAYRNCYRSMNSVQRTSYYAPAEHMNDLRLEAEQALGSEFDLIHWNRFILRVDILPWDMIDHLNQVYIQWRLGNQDAADMDGYAYLVCQVFGNTWVNNMGASHQPILDDRSMSNPTKLKDKLHKAAKHNHHVKNLLDRIRENSYLGVHDK